ncbi:MAG TPA: hypothetical protein ENI61_00300 [Ignavibacteria bacterium]|nr:hypothetical protein [Ignavibacteria bacterium]
MNDSELKNKLEQLRNLPAENEVVEFKGNNKDPQEIGEYISALSNSAALHNKPFAYICWGIENKTHQIVGTDFNPKSFKVGNEELENYPMVSKVISDAINCGLIKPKDPDNKSRKHAKYIPFWL